VQGAQILWLKNKPKPSTCHHRALQLVFVWICCAAMLFFRDKRLLPVTVPNKPYLFSLCLIVLSWTLTFNMLTEACRVWDAAPGFFCSFSEHCTVWPLGELAGTSTAGRIDSCFECFVSNISHCRMMDFKLLGKYLKNPSQIDEQQKLLLWTSLVISSSLVLC